MKKLRKCNVCHTYTLSDVHCGLQTRYGHPPPFKITDRWARYRRKEKFGV
ncbi:MAG: nucleolar RNA-binding Nop10p family protein [Candidatus Anstonellales archaeon]